MMCAKNPYHFSLEKVPSSKDQDSNINKILISEIVCSTLSKEVCTFSLSSYAACCVLEKSILMDGNDQYECQCKVDLDHSPLIDYLDILISFLNTTFITD
jgi:hypothetical protein